MDMTDMPMGSMSMGDGIPALLDFPKYYYAVVGSAVGVATLVNIYNHVLYRQRISAAKKGVSTPAKPRSAFTNAIATSYAIGREAFHASLSLPSLRFLPPHLRTPTFGPVFLVLANIAILLSLCFYGFDNTLDWANFENIGYRTGFISMAQIPLIFLLAGKNNIIGFLTGLSHERLNWLHRWCARCLFLTSTIHFGYWLGDWWPFGEFVSQKLRTDPITYRGVIAWCFLVWIVFSSMTPIRGWKYELFVLQHLVSFALFIGFVYIHTPAEVHIYIWVPVGIFFFDRVTRALFVAYTNISYFHPRQRSSGDMKGFWACRATFTPLSHETTKITINNPPISWQPGQHVFLSCHSIVPLQSHPFTVASLPSDGKMDFFVKAEKGGTRRFFRHAEKVSLSLPTEERATPAQQMKSVAIEGPFGRIRPLRQFDSVVLFAGSTGATFTVPLLRDVVAGWVANEPVVTRSIRFVWVVKSRGQVEWFSQQLSAAAEEISALRSQGRDLKIEMSVYVTCDESFTEEHKSFMRTWQHAEKDQEKHGKVEEVRSEASGDAKDEYDEKKPGFYSEEKSIVRETSASSSNDSDKAGESCGPDGTCCCTGTIEDEDAITKQSGGGCCCCGPSQETSKTAATTTITTAKPNSPTTPKSLLTPSTQARPSSYTSTTTSTTSPPKSILTTLNLSPQIHILAGRPQPRTIIRKALEQALGESAVVVCGPKGLVRDVRASTVELSDERGVHKGTGAQGLWYYGEQFGY